MRLLVKEYENRLRTTISDVNHKQKVFNLDTKGYAKTKEDLKEQKLQYEQMHQQVMTLEKDAQLHRLDMEYIKNDNQALKDTAETYKS